MAGCQPQCKGPVISTPSNVLTIPTFSRTKVIHRYRKKTTFFCHEAQQPRHSYLPHACLSETLWPTSPRRTLQMAQHWEAPWRIILLPTAISLDHKQVWRFLAGWSRGSWWRVPSSKAGGSPGGAKRKHTRDASLGLNTQKKAERMVKLKQQQRHQKRLLNTKRKLKTAR